MYVDTNVHVKKDKYKMLYSNTDLVHIFKLSKTLI